MNHNRTFLSILFLNLVLLVGCNSPPENPTIQTENISEKTEDTLDITVSILPQKYFVEQIGGDRIAVNVMVEAGASPATYEPKPQQMKALTEAEAYISIDVPFEKAWLTQIKEANSQMLMIDSIAGIEKREMVAHHHHDDEHNHENSPEEKTLDPHTWLSPVMVKVQAENIYQGLVKLDPDNQEEYEQNLREFQEKIEQLDQKIKQNLANIENRKFMVFHPAWGYFADQYNLEQIAIEVGGQEPSASELAQLITMAKKENIRIIFAQPEFSTKQAKTIAQEINGKVLLITALAPDWSNNLLEVSQTFAEVLK